MEQSKAFVDASHAINDLSHALALLESENASLRGAADGLCNENAELRELMKHALINLSAWMGYGHPEWMVEKARQLGIEVDE